MKVHGKSLEQSQPDYDGALNFIDLGEICITAKPKELRKLAKFLKSVAKEIKNGNESDHYHFRSRTNVLPDFVILNPEMIP